MSTRLHGDELNYLAVDKQEYAVFKVVKQFRPYILKKRTKIIVPYPTVRILFVQKELGERRRNWETTLQEYDLEFKPATIIKGQGLCKLIAEIHTNEDCDWENEAELNRLMYVLSLRLPNIGIETWCITSNKDIYRSIGTLSNEGSFV